MKLVYVRKFLTFPPTSQLVRVLLIAWFCLRWFPPPPNLLGFTEYFWVLLDLDGFLRVFFWPLAECLQVCVSRSGKNRGSDPLLARAHLRPTSSSSNTGVRCVSQPFLFLFFLPFFCLRSTIFFCVPSLIPRIINCIPRLDGAWNIWNRVLLLLLLLLLLQRLVPSIDISTS